jgi:hydrogenase maturation protease
VADILVIGYGNDWRGDDGLGPLIAASVAALNLPGVRVRTALQLLPELAADLAEVRLVIFVDASEDPSESGVQVRALIAEDATDWCTHHADPRPLLALTRALYERIPEAWWLTVSGRNFDIGQGLSVVAEKNARRAFVRLKRLIQEVTTRASGASRTKSIDRRR